jgi:hypothetical protein
LVAIFSDHGQIRVIPDDRHSLRLAFPFEREIGHLFDALGLDVHDFPGEDPDCDAVVAANGGLGYVYLQNQRGRWADAPEFDRDLLPIGRAFWEAHQTGKYATELAGALSGVLVRNVARNGWDAPYQAITPDGDIVPLEKWFGELARQQKNHGAGLYVDPVHRLGNLVSPFVGDLLLISNYAEGYYFGSPLTGVHGGLHPDDSRATLVFGYPGKSEIEANQMRIGILDAIETRCQTEGGRQPSTADLITGLFAILE